MINSKTKIYTIPIDDKFIIYAPLKPMAFIGNRALLNAIRDKLDLKKNSTLNNNGLIMELEKTGLFTPDKISFPSCDCNQPFNPTLCILMPTTACNLACIYCYASYEGKKNVNMEWPVAKKAIDIAFENSKNAENNKFALSFHGGGEPTLNRALFFKASEYARKLDPQCPISVTTNGLWDNNFRNRALNILTEISVSMDGSEVTQNRQRPDSKGNETFSQVFKTIRHIEKKKINYGIRMTVTKESLPELRSNVEFLCNETKCNTFQIEAVYNQGRAVGAGLTIQDIDNFVKEFIDVYQYTNTMGKSLHYSSARPDTLTNSFCTATSNALIVTSDGELTACYEVFDRSHLLAEEFIIGKIDLHEGVLLYPKKRKNLLKKISNNRDTCKDCFCYYHCAGDCPPKSIISNLNNDQFRCSVTRSITRELILDKIINHNGFWQGGVKRNLTFENGDKTMDCKRCEK